jgi:RHS repeat-associated protein
MLKEYARGLDLGGGIAGIIYQKKGADYYYYHYNHKGDVVALTDANAKLAAFYEYDAWGNTMTQAQKSGVDNPYRYSTKEWDEKSGLYYFGFRYYSPEIGRWTQRDPAGTVDALSLYAYCKGDPGGRVDPWGELPIAWSETGKFDVLMEPNPSLSGAPPLTGKTQVQIGFRPSEKTKKCCKGYELLQAARTVGDKWSSDKWHYDMSATGVANAVLNDWPGRPNFFLADRNFDQYFETCAVCTAGAWRGRVLGCLTWGHKIRGGAVVSCWPGSGVLQPEGPCPTWLTLMWGRITGV